MRLTMTSTGEALNVCPRPVFWEELDFLGAKDLGWEYPHCQEPIMWACDRRYFYRGELVLEVKGGDLQEYHKVTFSEKNITLKPINTGRLKATNEDALFLLEHEAMEFIDGEYRKYKSANKAKNNNPNIDFHELAEKVSKKSKVHHSVIQESCGSFEIMTDDAIAQYGRSAILKRNIDFFVCSFSGGKDSQVILDLVTRVIPGNELVVIYSDTGYELPTSLSLYDDVQKHYRQKYPDLKFFISKNHQKLMYYWDILGAPSRMRRWCCSIMKSAPLARLLKEINGGKKQPNAILFDGVRAEESANRSTRSRIGVNAKHNNIINISPILHWNSTEIYLYLILNKLPFNRAYRQGFSRVGCVICPYSSKWSENLASKLYPETISPFVCKIKESLEASKTAGIEAYIKEGKWKERAGGRSVDCEANLTIINEGVDFKAILKSPRENVLMWLNILGRTQIKKDGDTHIGVLNYKKKLYKFRIEKTSDDTWIVEVKETCDDVVFLSHLKKVLYKATYCVHCEVCEVECPTGALCVVPKTSIDINKCIHCLKCIDFDGKGCLSASSVSISTGEKKNTMTSLKSGINRYNNGMGLRENWLKCYFSTYETFFDNEDHGLNARYQVPPFVNWLRESRILSESDKTITEIGLKMKNAFAENPNAVWEIIFINLTENSVIAKWYFSSIEYYKQYTNQELEIILQDSFPSLKDRTLKNPLSSLLNTFKESPLGKNVPVGVPISIEKKPGFTRLPHNDLSLVATAYSLYRYAEKSGRRSLTVSEFYNPEQKEGIVRQFGIEREAFEQNLRTLEQERNHVLRAELKMGLDNIILRDDLTSDDIIKMML